MADIKTEQYLTYHSALIMSSAANPYYPVIMYNLMMTEKILTNQRTYTQLVDVLGDVGGLMEVIESIFGVISVLVADILYDKTMINNLFSFDLEDNVIKFKTKSKNIIDISISEDFDKKTLDISKKQILEKKETINPKVKQINIINKSNCQNISNSNIISSQRSVNFKKSSIKTQKYFKYPQSKTLKNNNGLNQNNNVDIKIYEIDKDSEKKIERKNIIKKLDTNIFCTYFCFCFSRKRENFANTLMDEAMKIITDKLDIYNIFRNMYYVDDIKKKNNYIYEDIEISDECKQKLKEISNKIYNSFYQL